MQLTSDMMNQNPKHSQRRHRHVIDLISDDEASSDGIEEVSRIDAGFPLLSIISDMRSNMKSVDPKNLSKSPTGYEQLASPDDLGRLKHNANFDMESKADQEYVDLEAEEWQNFPGYSEDVSEIYGQNFDEAFFGAGDSEYAILPDNNPDPWVEVPVDNAITMKVRGVNDVISVFPDICRDYVSELYDTFNGHTSEQLIALILDKMDKNEQYPTAKGQMKSLKRKRGVDEDEETKKYESQERENYGYDYKVIVRQMLSGEFPHVPMSFLDTTLSQAPHLFPAYRLIEEAERNWTSQRAPPYQRIKSARKINPHYLEKAAQNTIDANSPSTTPILMLALRELQASRRARLKTEEKLKAEAQAVRDEEENIRRAEADGTMTECGCCFGDFPLNRMVHCNSNSICHWFCRGCARQTAETEIGNSKYELHCMSMDGCSFGFSRDQKNEFLDEKTMVALDRNEQEAMLRMAGIENLETCPFCPFAAEYPPVEEDRLFRCQAPDCEMVSCRLCRLESHIPKTCEENAKDNGLSARRLIEEAMSAALIRKCNKCSTPFVKIDGCNKMTCTRGGCFNVQCYVCSKSCSYDHFDDRSRGGKAGNCPLFENVDQRHDQEVEKAEKEALAKVRAEHPEFSEDDLKVKVSEVVRRDEEIRKNKDPRIPNRFGHPANMPDWALGAGLPAPFAHVMQNPPVQVAPAGLLPNNMAAIGNAEPGAFGFNARAVLDGAAQMARNHLPGIVAGMGVVPIQVPKQENWDHYQNGAVAADVQVQNLAAAHVARARKQRKHEERQRRQPDMEQALGRQQLGLARKLRKQREVEQVWAHQPQYVIGQAANVLVAQPFLDSPALPQIHRNDRVLPPPLPPFFAEELIRLQRFGPVAPAAQAAQAAPAPQIAVSHRRT